MTYTLFPYSDRSDDDYYYYLIIMSQDPQIVATAFLVAILMVNQFSELLAKLRHDITVTTYALQFAQQYAIARTVKQF